MHLNWLGLKVKDRVTGFAGVVTSVSFDLFGCIQVVVSPAADNATHKLESGCWFDVSRLEMDGDRVMDVPCYARTQTPDAIASGEHGPADKPAQRR